MLLVLALLGSAVCEAARQQADIVYGEAAGERLKLDASIPDGTGPYPIAILIHGGGWVAGDKAADPARGGADISPWFDPLRRASFTWFSINYRLAPKHRWPACLEDVQTAIRWVKANAAAYKGDPSRIALVGHSAGGHLAFLAAVLAAPDTRVRAVVGFAPVTDFEFELPLRGGLSSALQKLHDRPQAVSPESLAVLRETAPVNHLKAGMPPFLILHGDADKTVPLQESVQFRDKVRSAGGSCELHVLPGAQHRLSGWDKCDPTWADTMIRWLGTALASGAGGR